MVAVALGEDGIALPAEGQVVAGGADDALDEGAVGVGGQTADHGNI